MVAAAGAVFAAIATASGSSADDLERFANVIAVRPPVTATQLAPFEGTGSGSITGRLVASLPGDRLRIFSDYPVYAAPVIPYTFWFARQSSLSWIPGRGPTSIDQDAPDVKRFFKLQHLAATDAQGVFKFTDLPAGTWMVYSLLIVRDGRTYTQAHTSESMDMEYEGNRTDANGDSQADFEPMPHENTTYTQGHYTCETAGGIIGTIEVKADHAASIPLALIGVNNDGC